MKSNNMRSSRNLFMICFLIINFMVYGHANDKSNTKNAGDVLLFIIPATTYGITYLNDDSAGRDQFYKSFGATFGTTYLLKYSVDAERPENNGDQSFPSGHTSLTFQSAAFIHQRYGLKYAIPAYISASFVGWTRVDSKQHYTRDVLAGALIGTLSSFYFTTPYKNTTITPIVQSDAVGFQAIYKW